MHHTFYLKYVLAGEQTTMQVVPDIGGRKQEHPSHMYASDKHREHYYYRPKNGQKRRNYYFLLCRVTVWRYVIFLRICIEYYT